MRVKIIYKLNPLLSNNFQHTKQIRISSIRSLFSSKFFHAVRNFIQFFCDISLAILFSYILSNVEKTNIWHLLETHVKIQAAFTLRNVKQFLKTIIV